MCRWLLAACAVVVLVRSPEARADALGDARKAVEGSDYPAAKTALETALQSGTNSPAELAEIYKLSGMVEGALNNATQATIWFGKWIALDPKAGFPEGTSPRFKKPFDAAAKEGKKRGVVEAKVETEDNPPTVTLVIVNDPLKLIVGAKVLYRVDKKPEDSLEAEGTGRIKLELDVGKRIDLRVQALDEYGNRVVELGTKDVPIVITSSGQTKPIGPDPNATKPDAKKPTTPAAPEEPTPWYGTWWVWGIGTGVSALATGVFAYLTYSNIQDLNTLNANSYNHVWSDAQDVEHTARRNLLITDIGLGVTGGLLVGTAILYLLRPTGSESEPAGQTAIRAAITPVPGGGAVVLGGQF